MYTSKIIQKLYNKSTEGRLETALSQIIIIFSEISFSAWRVLNIENRTTSYVNISIFMAHNAQERKLHKNVFTGCYISLTSEHHQPISFFNIKPLSPVISTELSLWTTSYRGKIVWYWRQSNLGQSLRGFLQHWHV